MARNMYAVCGITEEEFRALFAELKTVKAVARKLGVSKRTVSKYRMELGIKVVSHRPPRAPGVLSFENDFGPVARWIREHPGEQIPYDYAEATKVTGLSADSIQRYIERRNRKILDWAKSLGDLRRLASTTLVDVDGRKIPMEYVQDYRLKADGRRGVLLVRVRLSATLETEVRLTVEAYAKLFDVDFTVQMQRLSGGGLPERLGRPKA